MFIEDLRGAVEEEEEEEEKLREKRQSNLIHSVVGCFRLIKPHVSRPATGQKICSVCFPQKSYIGAFQSYFIKLLAHSKGKYLYLSKWQIQNVKDFTGYFSAHIKSKLIDLKDIMVYYTSLFVLLKFKKNWDSIFLTQFLKRQELTWNVCLNQMKYIWK